MSETILEAPAKAKRGRPSNAAAVPVVPDHSSAIADAMARLAEGIAKLTSMGGGASAGDLGDAIANALEKNRIAKLSSNPDPNYVGPSVFEPHGLDRKPLPKAALVRETYTNNHPERAAQLRPDEIDAFNLLSASLPNPGMVRRAHNGKWLARVNDEGNRLYITWPCKAVDDQFNGPKGILALCKELTDGTEVPTVDSMLSQMIALKKQNDAIMALLSQRPELAAQVAAATA